MLRNERERSGTQHLSTQTEGELTQALKLNFTAALVIVRVLYFGTVVKM